MVKICLMSKVEQYEYKDVVCWIGCYKDIPFDYVKSEIYKIEARGNEIVFILDRIYEG